MLAFIKEKRARNNADLTLRVGRCSRADCKWPWRGQDGLGKMPQGWRRGGGPIALDNEIIERAAKALLDSVFSSCGRLDWTSCDESTKGGFRREATAVINAVWPDLVCVSSYQRDGIADSMIRDTGRS